MLDFTNKGLLAHLQSKGLKAGATEAEAKEFTIKGVKDGTLDPAELEAACKAAPAATNAGTPDKDIAELKAAAKAANEAIAKLAETVASKDSALTPEKAFAWHNPKSGEARVKGAWESYDSTKSELYHPTLRKNGAPNPIAGMPVTDEVGRKMESPSELDLAVIGAYFKHAVNQVAQKGQPMPKYLLMNDHDRQLVEYAAHEMKWVGANSQDDEAPGPARKLTDLEVKFITNQDGGTSGGTQAVPLVYDDAVILTSLLYGELYPFVNVINIDRGSSVHGYSIQRPTLTANVTEGNSISLFNTASFIATFDTTIYNTVGAMEFGLDWQEDSPVDVAQLIVKEYGEAAMAYLDKVVAVGDGSTQPLGIFNASNTVAVPNIAGGVGPLTVGDFEALYFGLTKAERNWPRRYLTFVGNDNTYRRSRAIPLGSDDARRFYGNDYDSYTVSGRPFKVSVDIADNELAFCNLQRYRMYRRLGATFRYVTDGQTLALKNTSLVVLRMRFGGQPELGAGFAIMSNAPTAG